MLTMLVGAILVLASVLRLEGRVFFFNAEHIAQIDAKLGPRCAAEDRGNPSQRRVRSRVPALKMLIEGERRHRESGVLLWLVGLNPEVLAVVRRSPLGETLGRERMHFTLEVALDKYLAIAATDRTL